MNGDLRSAVSAPESEKLELWDVNAFDVALGVGKRLGRVAAKTLRCAEAIAHANYGKRVLVSPSGGKPRRRRKLARDLGNTGGAT